MKRHGRRRHAAVVLLTIAALMALPSIADAASVQVNGDQIVYTALPGEINALRVTYNSVSDVYTLTDSVGIVAGSGCSNSFPNQATCPGTGISALDASLGDQPDQFGDSGVSAPLPVIVDGGDGDDHLYGGQSSDQISGGNGNDTIEGGDDNSATTHSADHLYGGPGQDHIQGGAGTGEVLDGGPGDDVLNGYGSEGSQTLDGGIGIDQINGGGGNDLVLGGDGGDFLDGGAGDDTIDGGAGPDQMSGGTGVNTLDYSARTNPVHVSLDGGDYDGEAGENDIAGSGFQIVLGGSGNDILTGDIWANTLDGGAGDDTLDGGSRNCGTGCVDSDQNADELIGGPGNDTASFAGRTVGVQANLDGVANDGDHFNDWVTSSVENLSGGFGNDTLTGNSDNNKLLGSAGDDTLRGNGGDDYIDGESGTNDLVDGGLGTDVLIGETADYTTRTEDLRISLDGVANDGADGGAEGDNVQTAKINSGSGNDVLIGNDSANIFNAGAGDDVIKPGRGGNRNTPSLNEIHNGGPGNDTVDYSGSTDDLYIGLDYASIPDQCLNGCRPDGGMLNITTGNEQDLISIENARGGQGDDTIQGSSGANDLEGGGGADVLKGWAGADTLDGGDGADTLQGGVGQDSLDGGTGDDNLDGGAVRACNGIGTTGCAGFLWTSDGPDNLKGGPGIDTANYSVRTSPVTLTLDGGIANDGQGGGAEGDAIGSDIENLTGGSADDSLTGSDQANVLTGGDGADTLVGGAGADSFSGDNGDDQVNSRDTNGEPVACGAGSDTVTSDPADTVAGDCEANDNGQAIAVVADATGITGTTATLQGTVNPNGSATTYRFEWGTTTSYGNVSPATPADAGSDSSAHPFSASLSSLSAATTYHFRLVATNQWGTTHSSDMTFTTVAAPAAATGSASAGPDSAILHGSVDSHGLPATYHFEYGPDTSYGSSTSTASVPSGDGSQQVSATASSLASGTYHYRVVAQTDAGTTYGSDATFTTDPTASSVRVDSGTGTLVFRAADGVANSVAAGLSFACAQFTCGVVWGVTDFASTVVPGPGCRETNGMGLSGANVECDGVLNADVQTGDGNDSVSLYDSVGAGNEIVDAGSGADQLQINSSFGSVIARGGPGADTFSGSNYTVDYSDHAHAVTITLGDNQSNDGSDEDGAAGSRDHVTGASGVIGTAAADDITGGPGAQTINAAGGDDHVDTKGDSVNDTVDCGSGSADSAVADQGDALSNCESVDHGEPVASTSGATNLTQTGATLHGSVNPRGVATTYKFEWGTSTGYGNDAPSSPVSVGSDSAAHDVAFSLTGLVPNTTYHYRVVATSSAGTSHGDDQQFTTAATPPSATTGNADSLGQTTATLHGSVNPGGSATTYHFELGTTTAYGQNSPATDAAAGSDSANHSVAQAVSGLQPNTTYHYRIVATNCDGCDAGTTRGADQTFTTLAPPSPPSPPAPPADSGTGGSSNETPPSSAPPAIPVPIGDPPPPGVRLAGTQTGPAVAGNVMVLQNGSTVDITLTGTSAQIAKAKNVVVGHLVKRSVKAGVLRFKIKLNAKGVRALKKAKRLRLSIVVKITPRTGKAIVLRKTVTLKR